jgi:protein gp37
MAERTGIEWADATWNPWQGCQPVSAGCDHCYMYREKRRYGQDPGTVVRSSHKTFSLPLRLPAGARVFVCSWSDFWLPEADAWRGEAWEIMRRRPDLVYMIPTKRPENIGARLPSDWGKGWGNVWGLVSVESQEYTQRIDTLLGLPFAVRGVSAEPLLGPLDLTGWMIGNWRIDWLIAGGESGPEARMMHPEWAWHLQRQADSCRVPFFFKQWGECSPVRWRYEEWACGDVWMWPDGRQERCGLVVPGGDMQEPLAEMWVEEGLTLMRRRGVKDGGRELYGQTWGEVPG